MQHARTTALAVGVAGLVLAGCGATPGPIDGVRPSVEATVEAIMPMPTDALTVELVGAWRQGPIMLDPSHVAIISDACAAAAREQLGQDEADLPTALIDARGAALATAILADDLFAIECRVHLDASAQIATVDSVASVSMTRAVVVEGGSLSVVSAVHEESGGAGRMVAVGRVGPDAASVRVTLDDGSMVVAAVAEGWWAAWWPGAAPTRSYSAVDPQGQLTATILVSDLEHGSEPPHDASTVPNG
jgi:hypothetical protein